MTGNRRFLALVVDNNRVFAEDACELLEERFASVADLDVSFVACDGRAKARGYLRGVRRAPYDIVFVDMMLPPVGRPDAPEDMHEPLGLDVIGWAKQAEVPVVVGYSQASQEQLVNLEREVRELGGHRFYHRGQLFGSVAQARPAVAELAMLLAGDPEPEMGRAAPDRPPAGSAVDRDKRTVAVVHGRNTQARHSLYNFLRAVNLAPVEWEQAVAWTGEGTPTIPMILDMLFTRAQAVIVLLTPDEEVRLAPALLAPGEDDEAGVQARPNVYFEAGMAFARYPERTILVEIGRVRAVSDLFGRYILRLNNSPECREALSSRLERAGCDVRRSGDWFRVGDFG